VLPGVFALVSLAAHREPLGFGLRELKEALRAWRLVLLVSAAVVIAGVLLKGHPLTLFFRGMVYFAWCVLQQLLLQDMIYRRIRSTLGATAAAAFLSGVLFAAVHFPNPVLVPATLVWGAIATRLFERRRSIIAIALMQTLLSSLFIWLTPVAWNHQFRVGPGYWLYR
jgi:membrane protease YdiL (CAAX protease family)